MGKRLVITEKPSVAKDIAKALGGFVDEGEYLESEDYVVTWAVGHLLKLADPKEYGFKSFSLKLLPMLPESWVIMPRTGKKGRLDQIRKLGRRKDIASAINACDAGREGELIYRRIAEFTGVDQLPQERLWLSSMTTDAIRTAFDELRPGKDLDTLADAAWLRSVGDWLVGMNASRAITQKLGRSEGMWSAGRVQTPTLALLVAREREILAHEPRPYWELTATFQHGEGEAAQEWTGIWWDPARSGPTRDEKPTRLFDRAEVDALVKGLARAKVGDASEKRKQSKQSPPMLYDLTTLQREANKRFSMPAKRTLDAAQRLYEQHKLTTYPRTDSRYLPDDYGPVVDQLVEWVEAMAGIDGLDDLPAVASKVKAVGPQNLSTILDSTKVSDHFAIVPTGNPIETKQRDDDVRVFSLNVRQFIAALMGPATWATVERIVDVAVDEPGVTSPARFRTTARALEIPGFLEALGVEEGKGTHLPALVPGQGSVEGVAVDHLGTTEEAKLTRPPGRYTEAQLLRMMETAGERIDDDELSEAMKDSGLGTPATRADTIETLCSEKRQYARRIDGKLAPTAKAMRLIDVLERAHAAELAAPKLTGEWEHKLAEVEKGHLSRDKVYAGLVDMTTALTRHIVDFEYKDLYANEAPIGTCPECGGTVWESTRGYICENNSSKDEGCRFILWKDRMGRYIDRKLATELIEKGQVGPIDDFVDTAGRRYLSGTITLQSDPEKGWVMKTEFGDAPEESDVEEIIEGEAFDCPCGEGEPHKVIRTNLRWACDRMMKGDQRRGPVLPREVCKRPMSDEEAAAYFSEEARTEVLTDFVSKRGRPFRGLLFRKPTGRHGFEFPPRGSKKAEGEEGGETAATEKTATKKAAPRKAAPKKAAGEAEAAAAETASSPATKAASKKSTSKKAKPKTATAPKDAPKRAAPAKAAPEPKAPAKPAGKRGGARFAIAAKAAKAAKEKEEQG